MRKPVKMNNRVWPWGAREAGGDIFDFFIECDAGLKQDFFQHNEGRTNKLRLKAVVLGGGGPKFSAVG